MKLFLHLLLIIALTGIISCGSPHPNRSVRPGALGYVQVQYNNEVEANAAKRDILSPIELMDLSDCESLYCLQQKMKNLVPGFIYLKKGEWTAQHRITLTDTSGKELTLPVSTFYVDVNPQATWRAVHTIHIRALGDSLLNGFKRLGFQKVDEGPYAGINNKRQCYLSEKYLNKSLYITTSFQPWHLKGLYNNKVTWPCYMFEVYNNF